MSKLSKLLPKHEDIWAELLDQLGSTGKLELSDIDNLQKEVIGLPRPYLTILRKFSDNGRTIGELLGAMGSLKQTPELSLTDKERIGVYIKKVEEIRTTSFEAIFAKVKSLEEFEQMSDNYHQKLKTNQRDSRICKIL